MSIRVNLWFQKICVLCVFNSSKVNPWKSVKSVVTYLGNLHVMNKRYGITLIELLVVIFIIAIMTFAALAVFKNFRETTSVKVAARDVASIMRLARQKAVIERVDYYALYDITNKTIWVQPASSYPPKNPDPGTEQSLPDGAVIDHVTAAGGSDPYYHTFTPKSTKSGLSGGVYLTDKDSKIKYRVTVINTTARARIYDSWPP